MKRIFLIAAVILSPFCVVAQTSALKKPVKKPRYEVLPLAENIVEHKNIEYASYGERTMELDLYLPKSEELLPLVLVVHGGGWKQGTRAKFQPIAAAIAAEGFAVANISYRLSGEAQFPAAVHDCKAAVRWARANATQYGIHPDKIYGMGGSAGGHLVGMLATTAGKLEGNGGNPEQSSAIQAAVILGGGMDQYARGLEAEADGEPIDNCLIFFGATVAENPKIYKEGSPLHQFTAATPPIRFIDGDKDRPGERYVEIRKLMDKEGVYNDLVVVDDCKHGQWNREPQRGKFVSAISEFFWNQAE